MRTFYLILFLLWSSFVFSQADTQKLLGTWQYSNQMGTTTLVFNSASRLTLDGVPASYTISGNTLQVYADGQTFYYTFRLSGNVLSVTFPEEGFTIPYKKVSSSTSSASANVKIKGKVYLLRGTFCSYSGSSSSYSSYSSSTRVYFDGRGNFQYKTETSFSSEAGIYSNDGEDGVSTGKYDVNGNVITLYFPDGSVGYAQVYFVQDDGSISEIKYEDVLYAKNLCE